MEAELSSVTAYRVSQALERIAGAIDQRRLSATRIGYASRFKRPLDGDELTEEGQAVGEAKMISEAALDALASISANPKDDRERLIIRIVDLFVCGGFRPGEVLTLPENCWATSREVSAPVDPKTGIRLTNHGITYAAEKAQRYTVKWLPREAVELANRAITELTTLCAPARAMAAWMEAHPGRLKPFEDLQPDHLIVGREACRRLGLEPSNHPTWRIPRQRRGVQIAFRVGDIERMFLERHSALPVLTMPSGETQKLSETLIVVWEHQLHEQRATLAFLPRVLTLAMLSGALSPSASRRNVSRGLLSGTGAHATPKQFRHWLNTIAVREGIGEVFQMKWFGRKDPSQNANYNHGSMRRMTDEVTKLVLKGEAVGPISRIAALLPLAEREDYVRAAINAAHATPWGMCVHNFAATPCPNHNQCLRQCGSYLRVKGDVEQREALLKLDALEDINIERAALALREGYEGADLWLAASKEIKAGIAEALAVDDDLTIEAGTERPVFPASASNWKPLQ